MPRPTHSKVNPFFDMETGATPVLRRQPLEWQQFDRMDSAKVSSFFADKYGWIPSGGYRRLVARGMFA
jgi:hypothetical protein